MKLSKTDRFCETKKPRVIKSLITKRISGLGTSFYKAKSPNILVPRVKDIL